MKRIHQFKAANGTDRSSHEACLAWADALADAADGLLNPSESEVLQGHVLNCAGCAWELADAQRGAAWLALLKDHTPEPPAQLLSSILEKTSGQDAPAIHRAAALSFGPRFVPLSEGAYAGIELPVWAGQPGRTGTPSQMQGPWHRLAAWFGLDGTLGTSPQPRLAMTSATAFFSVCLTLNLLGVSVRNLRAESLRPAGLQRTVAEESASLVRSFEGIRLVYRLESRVNEWRTASASDNEAPLDAKPSR